MSENLKKELKSKTFQHKRVSIISGQIERVKQKSREEILEEKKYELKRKINNFKE
jgi:hypothetical protein